MAPTCSGWTSNHDALPKNHLHISASFFIICGGLSADQQVDVPYRISAGRCLDPFDLCTKSGHTWRVGIHPGAGIRRVNRAALVGFVSHRIFLPFAPYLWVYLLGMITIAGLAIAAYAGFRVLYPALARSVGHSWRGVWSYWNGTWCGLQSPEWRRSYSACLSLVCLIWMAAEWERWFWLGLLIGLGVWLRPDGNYPHCTGNTAPGAEALAHKKIFFTVFALCNRTPEHDREVYPPVQ